MFSKTWPFICRPSVSFQVLSDPHLEIKQQYQSYEIPLCADYLILADKYRGFLQKQTQQFKLVFLILGNNEFYNGTFAFGLEKARQLEQESSFNGRLIILDRGRYDIPGSCVTILGCTLWSKIPHESRDIVQSKIKDFQKIKDWRVDNHNTCHVSDLVWLLKEIHSIQQVNENVEKRSQKQSILVVTHHAPSLERTSSPQHSQNPWKSAFGTDVLSHSLNGVKVWVFGDTQYTTDFREGGVRVVDSAATKDGFDIRKVIHV
ncbi:calcineurin-like phosphoesterase [Talaromyces proteolyticus]|uniref:Calcineurin-like phosphoesterase n=1 Tax=Talaromyces proteolyticus TaxID=1131652 RepID=A0AAD4KTW9_9EURO|nr:calcineurin-like phosphoesterase [Talaromyces proteolyticus]KAH8696476.1 calcineurin-like phosphoesterase [Talaromyces proteolyticus]